MIQDLGVLHGTHCHIQHVLNIKFIILSHQPSHQCHIIAMVHKHVDIGCMVNSFTIGCTNIYLVLQNL